MNLLLHYQKKIFNSLKNLEKKKLIQISLQLKRFTVELPPKNHKADISCNAAMILAKVNKTSPIKLGEILKKHLLSNFKEFKSIEIAGPGFLNICFNISFWREYLTKIIKLDSKYGSNATLKKKYNIEFVSANPTGPLHVGHCRGAVLGDVLSNLLSFNGNKVTKEYYVNDYGEQIKSFVSSVYYRILEITENKTFPNDKNLYPGNYIIDIAKRIIKSKAIKDFTNLEKIYKRLYSESLKHSMQLIKGNLNLLGVKHNNFVYESKLINNKTVSKVVKKLKKENKLVLVIGPFATSNPENYIKAGGIVIKGEPEMFFHKSKKKISDFKKLPKIVQNFKSYELDELSFPGWEVIFKNYTPKVRFLGSGATININASRGCPYSCFYYCVYPAQQGRKLRLKSPKKVLEEMVYFYDKLKVRNYIFRDPVFSLDKRHTKLLCEEIIKSKKNFNIAVETHLKNIDDELADIFLKSGINDLGGISPKTIDWVNPDHKWPNLIELKDVIKQTDQNLIPRLPVYPSYINKDWLSPSIYEKVSNVVNENGYPKEHEFTK